MMQQEFNKSEVVLSKPPSLLKWTGSKRSQAQKIYELSPKRFERYYEPFLGGGSVLFYFGDQTSFGSDIYSPLIDFWTLVKNKPKELIEEYRTEWKKLQQEFPEYYYEVRDRFNINPNGFDMAFLTRTCVNGIVRFNNDGKFNNSLHLSRRGMTPDNFKQNVEKWSPRIKKTTFINCSFEVSLDCTKKGDFVYMDPPYFGNKQRYISSINFENLWNSLEKLNRKGVLWALSFDGARGETAYQGEPPRDLYKKKFNIESGNSAVSKVLNKKIEIVTEGLYCNY